MRNRRLLLFAIGLIALGVVSMTVLLVPMVPTHRIRAVAKDLNPIQGGMSKSEVEAIFRVPPGNYSRGAVMEPTDPNGHVPKWHTTADWIADDACVRVYFDAEERVLFAASAVRVDGTTIWQRLRRRIGL